ncbi:MAG: phytanoyl-CoA dioxygenase family protein [Acidimicrobiales bacterium]|nr:phytanoyl-CoA dioxygenase family protein [Acidimicrobiales bacterium]
MSTPSVRRTFLDDERQEQFARDGYVVMPLLTEDDIAYFEQLIDELYSQPEEYFYTSAENFYTSAQNRPADPNFLKVHEAVVERFQARIDEVFDRHLIRHGYVMSKPPHSVLGVPLHQDEAFVNEPEVRGVLIWCPLVDTTLENGWLNVLPGSHRLLEIDRPTGHPPWPFRPVEDRLYNHLVPLEVRAGDVVAYDGALIHASPPNRSDAVRPVVGIGLTPAEVQLHCDFYVEEEDRVDRYYVTPEFYIRHELGVQPTAMYERVEPRAWDPPTVTEADIDGWYGPDPGRSPEWEPFMTPDWDPSHREQFTPPDESSAAVGDPLADNADAEPVESAPAPGPTSAYRRARRLAGRVKRRVTGAH